MHIRLPFVQNQPALFQAIFHISLQLFERSNRTVGINGIYHKLLVRNIHARNTLLGKQVIYLPTRLRRIRHCQTVCQPICSNFTSRLFPADAIYLHLWIIPIAIVKPLYYRKFLLTVGTGSMKKTNTETTPSKSDVDIRVSSLNNTEKSGSLSPRRIPSSPEGESSRMHDGRHNKPQSIKNNKR